MKRAISVRKATLAAHERPAAGQRRPETFDFLGFTHYCAKTRKNKFMVKRKTQAKRLARKLKASRPDTYCSEVPYYRVGTH
jgi:hypothetical protein